jgi:hypothetical protein
MLTLAPCALVLVDDGRKLGTSWVEGSLEDGGCSAVFTGLVEEKRLTVPV